ncbi:hypothetical protein C8R44DRAFT_755461 [Mycena epipterygia]|nr:hypothetical protein C8R44DRAFT_755461 [Mycena epipterygia]
MYGGYKKAAISNMCCSSSGGTVGIVSGGNIELRRDGAKIRGVGHIRLGACWAPVRARLTLASACARIQLDSAEGKHYHLTYMFERLLRHAAWDMRDHCGGRDGAEKTRGRRASKDWGYCDTTRSIKVGWSASVQWMQFNVKCSNKEQDLEVHTELVSGLLHSGVGWGQSGDFETLALIGS